MQSHDELILLMDRAAAIAGSDYKLAKMLGTGRQSISNWRHGQAPCPVEIQALMADIAGLDPVAELARAVVRKHEGTPKGDLLMRALGKASRLTGAAAGIAGAVVLAISGMTMPRPAAAAQVADTQCALCQITDARWGSEVRRYAPSKKGALFRTPFTCLGRKQPALETGSRRWLRIQSREDSSVLLM